MPIGLNAKIPPSGPDMNQHHRTMRKEKRSVPSGFVGRYQVHRWRYLSFPGRCIKYAAM